jgi:methionine sulfoxide reductase heme-binding subunit
MGAPAAMVRPMSTSVAAFVPWTDRAGRFSALRAAVFALVLAPGLWLCVQWWLGQLAPRPVTAAIHATGDWAVRFLLLALLVTPLRAMTRRNELIGVRRMLGLAGLAYVIVHVGLYVVDQRYDMIKVATEIALRTYLTIGFVALLGLAALGATSTDGMVKRLGAVRWGQLHGLVYWLTALALLHFFLQRKLQIQQPTVMSGLFLWLMGWRWLNRTRRADDVRWLCGLAVVAGIATMALEAGYYTLRNGFPFLRVLEANLAFDPMIRPGWWVLAAGLAMAVLAWSIPKPARPPRPAAFAPPST